ncbi:uncharacterized protein A4U43_C02F17790 [Asparagus officinalis]|uniref:TF-B3 domain-containing protein n=1 Tax=Asparagus officinalis TaxID=4686 RepID=A0A5P1FLR8_ASPOF|nr:uncharacterized protein A4U43_C02F17790 [Asparagus officinalis]
MAQSLQCASSQSFSFFFRVLRPGFSNRLTLPTKFVKNVLMNKKGELGLASLVNPIGEIWHVEVYKHADEDMCIGGLGWSELAHAHNLGLGYFLVFRYRGDMVFDFRAFDLSTCEIAYPSIAHWVAKKLEQTLPVLIDIEDEEEECSNSSRVSTESYSGYEKEELTKSNPAGGVCFEVKLSARYLYRGHVEG